jgi:hypothetical protein
MVRRAVTRVNGAAARAATANPQVTILKTIFWQPTISSLFHAAGTVPDISVYCQTISYS